MPALNADGYEEGCTCGGRTRARNGRSARVTFGMVLDTVTT
jgi:hypothetical protein